MTLLSVLEALFSRDDLVVIEMLNQSISIKKYLLKDKLFVIHSGFRFMLDSGKEFDILIDLSDLSNPQIIHTPVSNIQSFPQILGLVLFKKIKYIDAFSKVMVAGISEDNSKIYPIESKVEDIANLKLNHSEFYIFRAEDNTVIRRFPLSRMFKKALLQKNGIFYKSYTNS